MQWLDNPNTRRAHHSYKWSVYPETERPLWVADMDCRPPACVDRVLQDALAHGVFGYGIEPPGFREAWVEHLQTRHDWVIDPDWIVPVAGVVPAMRMALMAHPEITDVVGPHCWFPFGPAFAPPKFTQSWSENLMILGAISRFLFWGILELFVCLLGAFLGLLRLSWGASGSKNPKNKLYFLLLLEMHFFVSLKPFMALLGSSCPHF